jgi:hypothetical protein
LDSGSKVELGVIVIPEMTPVPVPVPTRGRPEAVLSVVLFCTKCGAETISGTPVAERVLVIGWISVSGFSEAEAEAGTDALLLRRVMVKVCRRVVVAVMVVVLLADEADAEAGAEPGMVVTMTTVSLTVEDVVQLQEVVTVAMMVGTPLLLVTTGSAVTSPKAVVLHGMVVVT